jgi:hypothetical protein
MALPLSLPLFPYGTHTLSPSLPLFPYGTPSLSLLTRVFLSKPTLLCSVDLDASSSRISGAFVEVVPSLFQIGAGLSHSRELRDIFEDVLERVVLPCQRAGCTSDDVRLLFATLSLAYSQLTTLPVDTREQYFPVVKRFLAGMSSVTVILYE